MIIIQIAKRLGIEVILLTAFLLLPINFATASSVQYDRHYFPLSVGSKWTYQLIISEGKKPIFSYLAKEENNEGNQFEISGKSNVLSGTITYSITRYNVSTDSFSVNVTDGYLGWRYGNKSSGNLFWRYAKLGPWEVLQTNHLSYSVLIGDIKAYLEANHEIRGFMGVVMCMPNEKVVNVKAGRFSDCMKNIRLKTIENDEVSTITFFAKGVGLVKEIQYDKNGALIYSLELVDYSVNK